MSVCLCVSTLEYFEGGRFLWVSLNWALGLRALGPRVIWPEDMGPRASGGKLSASVAALRDPLEPYGLGDSIALWPRGGEPPPPELAGAVLDIAAAGLIRFRDLDEAARCLETVVADYDRQSRLARALAEEPFDARQVTGRVLERALA